MGVFIMKRAATQPWQLVATLILASQVCAAAAGAEGSTVNLSGTWKLAAPQYTLAAADGSALPFTKNGRLAYERNKRLAAKGDYSFDLTMARCSAPGLPRLMLTPARFRIFQRPDIVTMMFEWNRQRRQIDFSELPKEPPEELHMVGVSSGRWDGDTLVVKSFGFSSEKLLDNYLPSSESLQLVERIRLRDQDTLEDRITITDPENFTRPWETVLTYQRQADETFPEDVCLDRKRAGQMPLPTSPRL